MRGNGRKAKHKRFKLLRGALHRGMAVALGVFLLASQLDLAAYAVEDSVVLEEADTESPPAVTQPEDGGETDGEEEGTSSENTEEKQPGTDDNGEEEKEQNPDGEDSLEEGNEDGNTEEEGVETGDENIDKEVGKIQDVITEEEDTAELQAEPVALDEPEETGVKETRAGGYFEEGPFRYTVTDASVAVSVLGNQRENLSGNLIIDEIVTNGDQEYRVTEIAEEGFSGCKQLTGIELPGSIAKIGDNAFKNCSQLTNIMIPGETIEYGESVFYGCTSLTTAEGIIKSTMTSIPNSMFMNCTGLTKVTLSGIISDIGEQAFYYCESLQSIIMSDTVTQIGDKAFFGCRQLTEVTIPNNSVKYGKSVFYACESLTGIEGIIKSEMTDIPESMFEKCSGLTEVNIPDNIVVIGPEAFSECEGLTKLTIPFGVTEIKDRAFFYCKNLPEITMPESLTTLGSYVFGNCISLKKVDMPDSVTAAGNLLFCGCASLEQVRLSSKLTAITDQMFDRCISMTTFEFPEGIKSIGMSGFIRCSRFQRFTIPASVVELNEYSFGYCSNMRELRIAVTVTEEGGQKKVNPIIANGGYTVYGVKTTFYGCPEERRIVFMAADGTTPLEGDDLAAAIDAYDKVADKGESVGDGMWYGWSLAAAKFHTITASSTTGGRIDPDGSVTVPSEDDQTFTMTPDEGYQIKSVKADGRDVTWEEAVQALADGDQIQTGKAGTYTFTNVQTDHTIEVSFEKVGGTTPGEENPPKGDNDPEKPGNDRPSGGTTGSAPGNDNSGGGNNGSTDSGNGGTVNADNAEAPAAEVMVTVVDSGVQAAPAAATGTAAPAAQSGQSKEPKTGDPTHMEIYATLAMAAGLTYMLLYFMEEGRGMTEREKEVFVAAFIRWAKKGGIFRKCCAMAAIFCILAYYHSVGKCRKEKLYPVLH